jgi:hypothetical protein
VALALTLAAMLSGRSAAAQDFAVRLGLAQAHITEVFIGCHAKGSEGYDRELDDFAPPPGIDTGYVGFVPKTRLPLLYKDIRGPKGPHEWTLQVRPAKERPVVVSWAPKTLPAGWTFTVVQGDTVTAMADTASLTVAAAGTLSFRAVEKAPAATAP